MAGTSNSLTVTSTGAINDLVWEVLEIAIHSLLYNCSLYPTGSFRALQKYGIPVQICVHPDVKQYVEQLLASARNLLKENSLVQIRFVVLSAASAVVRRYVFDITLPATLGREEVDHIVLAEQMLRSCLLKLATSDSRLSPLPATTDLTWTVELSARWSSVIEQQQHESVNDFMWVASDTSTDEQSASRHIVPISFLDLDTAKVQVYVEVAS